MQKLKHVTLMVLFIGTLMTSELASAQHQIQVDKQYCDSLALMAKAGAEAKQRGESLSQWRHNLTAMQSTTALSQDSVLLRVLPQVIDEAKGVFTARKTPIDTYVASFNSCMATNYGHYVSLS